MGPPAVESLRKAVLSGGGWSADYIAEMTRCCEGQTTRGASDIGHSI